MNQWITGAKLIVLALFTLVSLGMVAYDITYVWPARKCERAGAWWDPKDRQCLTPIPIWRLTKGALTGPPPAGEDQRVAPGVQSTSPPSAALANRAATNSRSDSRLR